MTHTPPTSSAPVHGPLPAAQGARPATAPGLFALISQQLQSDMADPAALPAVRTELADANPLPPVLTPEAALLADATPAEAVEPMPEAEDPTALLSPDGLAHALAMLNHLKTTQNLPLDKTLQAVQQAGPATVAAVGPMQGAASASADALMPSALPGPLRADKADAGNLFAMAADMRLADSRLLDTTGTQVRNAVLETLTTPHSAARADTPGALMKIDLPGSLQQQAAWQQALAERVVFAAGRQVREAELHLHPAELGPVNIRIETANERAALIMTAAHADTREALEAALPRLRDMFSQQGMELVRADVRNDSQGQSSGQQQPAGAQATSLLTPDEDAVATTAAAVRPQARHDGLLDLYA